MEYRSPEVEMLTVEAPVATMRRIEKAGRLCYKSEDNITEESFERFIKGIIKSGHESVIEHGVVSFRIVCSRSCSHQLVRHRLASYSQECVSGDTLVRKDKTIKELFERDFNQYGRTYNQTINLRSMNKDGSIIPNKIEKIFYKGKAETYTVKTKMGYEIRATLNHEFSTPNGFVPLRDLKVGDKVRVNGRPSLLKISDEELSRLYLERELAPIEIAELHSAPYRTIVRRLKQLGIFVPRKNDKNKEKYNKNHTAGSYEKMSRTLLKQYREGREPWNKGLNESHPSVKKQADALREHHHNNQFGEGNSNYKDGRSSYRRLKEDIHNCEMCGVEDYITEHDTVFLEVHHIDGDRSHNELENLIKVCPKCHRILDTGAWWMGVRAAEDEIVSIEYYGEEDVYDLEMKAPYHNYVANGFVVHNSTRYVNYTKEKFGSNIQFIVPQFDRDKQFKGKTTEQIDAIFDIIEEAYVATEEAYFNLIEAGVTPDLAREVLPNGVKTELVMTANMREWRHFIKVRGDRAAHPEIRAVAQLIKEVLQRNYPPLFDDL